MCWKTHGVGMDRCTVVLMPDMDQLFFQLVLDFLEYFDGLLLRLVRRAKVDCFGCRLCYSFRTAVSRYYRVLLKVLHDLRGRRKDLPLLVLIVDFGNRCS